MTSITDLVFDDTQEVSKEEQTKTINDFIQNELKAHEILRKDDYFVSDIINHNVFTERHGDRIIMGSNINLNKINENRLLTK